MRVVIVGWHEEAAVHVGVAAGFEAQELPQGLEVGVAHGEDPPFGHGGHPGWWSAARTIRNGSPAVW